MKSFRGCRLGLFMLVVLLMLTAFSLTSYAQVRSPHLVVNTHRLNIRSGPGVGHGVITSVPGGTELPVTGIDSGRLWFRVMGPEGEGWVNSHYAVDRGDYRQVPIISMEEEPEGPMLAPNQAHLVVNTGYLNIRSGPGAGHDTLGNVPGGTKLPVISRARDNLWYQVSSPIGEGWVNSYYTVLRGNFTVIPTHGVVKEERPDLMAGRPSTTPHLVVNTHRLNVRSGPGVGHEVITSVPGGTELPVIAIGSDNLWYRVMSPSGEGWVNSYYAVTRGDYRSLRRRGEREPTPAHLTGLVPRAVVNTHRLNIRKGPGAGHEIITSVPGGTTLAVLGLSSGRGWYLVEGSFGQGWLNNDFVVFRGEFSRVPVIS